MQTVMWRDAAGPRRLRILSSISLRASRAKASSNSSDGRWNPLSMSQPALATMTEVLPLPAAATRLRRSSSTTALRCSSVSGRDSILSNRACERSSSFITNVSLAFFRALAGASRNLWMFLSIRISGESDNDCGHRPAISPTVARASRTRSPMKSEVMYSRGGQAGREWSRAPLSVMLRRGATRRLSRFPANRRTLVRAGALSPDLRFAYPCSQMVFAGFDEWLRRGDFVVSPYVVYKP